MSSFRLERLESLLRLNPGANQPEIKAALEAILSELTDRLNQALPESSEFVLAAVRALKRMRGSGNALQRLDCLHQCHSFLIHHGNYGAAMHVADQHYRLATQIRSRPAMRTSLACLGLACGEAGNVGQALLHYTEGMEVARGLGDLEGEARILNNVGVTLNYAGLYRDAIPCFERVRALAQPGWSDDLQRKSLANIAQSYYYLEDFGGALRAVTQCVARQVEPTDATQHFSQTIREFTFVQVALESHHDDLAYLHANRCQTYARHSNSGICSIMADLASGRCEVRRGQVTKGLGMLEDALARSRHVDSSYRDALVAVVQSYDEANQPDIALAFADELLAHVRERRTMGVQALLAQPHPGTPEKSRLSYCEDANALERRHAELRARVAENGIRASRMEMLERLAVTADLREDNSGEHGYRVGKLSAVLAVDLGWSYEATSQLEVAARLHDLGKVGVPDRILASSQILRDGERRLMQAHTSIGAELLARSSIQELKMAEEIARHHHEWWDGTGYPDRLAASRIPIQSRVVALADVFDALTHGRPYAVPWSIDRALQEIRNRRGTQFDPDLTDRFLTLVHRLRTEHPDLDTYLGQAGMNSPFRQARNRIRGLLDTEACEISPEAVH